MREFNLLEGYPKPKEARKVSRNLRNIQSRIIASYRDKEFYDGSRNNGYGGFKYDGRWKKIAQQICAEYKLNDDSSILQIGCEKGYFLHDLKDFLPKAKIAGIEKSSYAIKNCIKAVENNIIKSDYAFLKFKDKTFDFILAIGVIYSLTLEDALKCLKEIQRVGKGKSFITLASYTNEEDYWLFKDWTILGTLLLKENEWKEILDHCKYTGDYYFTNAKKLNLIRV